VTLWRDASHLYLSINGSSDTITMQSWFDDPAYRVEEIVFADGTVWNASVLQSVQLVGTEGSDYLNGSYGDDVIVGFGGGDTLSGADGNDTLDGGTGNDALDGGVGNDIYVFGRGYGQDTISNYDTTAGNNDTIRLAADIAPSDVTLWRDASHLYLGINGSSDTITMQSWFDDPAYRVEQIEFADGTLWDPSIMLAAMFRGTDTSDSIAGTVGNDTLEGLGGDDSLTGDAGNDTLDGGTGNDALDGGAGNDTYVFGRGDGQDMISDYDTTSGNIDTIRLAADIAPSDVTLWRDASNLYLGINGTTDTITIQSWFDSSIYRVEQIQFGDGTVWDSAIMQSAQLSGTDGSDYLTGSAGGDVIAGLGGDDYITGDSGNDTLDGGAGNDTIDGGTGNDIYVFGRGYGQDTISDYDTVAGNTDTILLRPDVLSGDVTLWRDTSNLYLSINGTTDTITVQSWFDNPIYRVEQIEFADGTVWDSSIMLSAMFRGTDTSDSIAGTVGNDTLVGLGGNDSLTGDAGNDTLDGGTGNDMLDGGTGNDTYVFGRGYGQDTISDYDTTAGNNDTIRLAADIAPSDVTLWRDASHLYLGINGTSDMITMQSWFDDPVYRVEEIVFADGTVWNASVMQTVQLIGTEGSDYLNGSYGNDVIVGLGGDDYLTGGAGNDILDGGSGIDIFDGGTGNDTFIVDNIDDVVTENLNEGTDTVQASVSYSLGINLENLTLTGVSTIDGTGNTLNNLIAGNAADNILDGGVGADSLAGGLGNDTYLVDNIGDVVTENLNEGTDTVQASVSYSMGINLENLTLAGASAINGTGNILDNVITGNAAANVLDGGVGADAMVGGLGNDTYIVDNIGDTVSENLAEGTDTVKSDISYVLGANIENLTLRGVANINGTGNALNNIITGNAGNNALDGGAGNDWVYYNAASAGVTVDLSLTTAQNTIGAGTDTLRNFEFILGSNYNDTLIGNSLANTLNGGTGADSLIGGLGNDTYVVDNIGDVVTETSTLATEIDIIQSTISYTLGENVENLTLTGTTAINGTGNSLNNLITGNSAANILSGGLGNDTYVVGNIGDVVNELLSEGTDLIQSSVTYTLSANVENLTLTGAAAINGTGNESDNILTGNSAVNTLTGGVGSDTLNGGVGADKLLGGLGNDTYVVDNTGDVITELLNEGIDTVQSSVTYTLAANVDNLTLTGTTAINGTGNALGNVLDGSVNTKANVLSGGAGNDTYILGTSDTIMEAASAGTDSVLSAATYTLGANLENLTLTGTTAINGTGNTLSNILVGNSAANILSGGTGADTMSGGLGNDTYVVDNIGDVVNELLNEGSDLIQSSVTYTLSANVENLTLTGAAAINGTGNESDNVLTGNSAINTLTGGAGSDTLNGGVGADKLLGGLGNDVYVVDNAGDVITELLDEGIDTVQSSVTHTLAANVDNLTLSGTAAINGTGNTADNILVGNAAVNVLTGGAGNDLLNGGSGNDTLKGDVGNDILQGGIGNDTLTDTAGANLLDGGAGTDTLSGSSGNEMYIGGIGNDTITTGIGADIIAFNRGDGADTVNGGIGSDNTITLGGGINYADLALSKVNNNLVLETGLGEQITLVNWYDTTVNNKSVIDLQVMADAMAAFDVASGDPLYNQAVQNFDFTAVVNAFDQARGGSATYLHWSMTNTLLSAHLSASDIAALGGDLAHQYGKNGTLSGMNLSAAQAALNDSQFGFQPQALNPLPGLQGGAVVL
jgi:Ca2+-binding RTX toxin-like protein